MDEMASSSSSSSWSYQEVVDELKLKIHYAVLELEIVKAKANQEMNRNTESVKQLLHLLKLVCHERDEARDQIQKLLIKIMPLINNPTILNSFMVDQVHQHNISPLMKPAKANSSIAESNSHSDAYNHSSSPVDSLFDPVTSPEFPKINTNTTSFIQDVYHRDMMLSGEIHALSSVPKIDHATLMMETMIKGKALPQKGNLLQAVMEAGPLLQTLLETGPIPRWENLSPFQSFCNGAPNQMMMTMKQSQPFVETSGGGVNILCFDDVRFSNFGLVEKRQRLL